MPRRSRLSDVLLLRRIQSYTSSNPLLTSVDADALISHLFSRFPEYRREKLHAFSLKVHRHIHLPSPPSSSTSSETSPSSCEDFSETRFDFTKHALREKYRRLNSRSTPKPDEKVAMEVETTPEKVPEVVAAAEKPKPEEGAEKEAGELGFESGHVMFDDLGGIDKVLDELTMDVLFPLCYPALLRKVGSLPGILLHGPPGCGKTTLARAIANQAGVGLYQISAPEIVSGVTGESEKNIRDIFENASRTAPSILLIDEIDAIGSKRESTNRQMEKRIVTQLITCLDKLCHIQEAEDADPAEIEKKPFCVVVIGTTNSPNSIDPALRARFQEILLNIPDENARKKILSVLIKKLKFDVPLDVEKIAKSTSGFVGRDLIALVGKARKLAMRRIFRRKFSEISEETQEIDMKSVRKKLRQQLIAPEELQDIDFNVTVDDFEEATMLLQPSLKREGFSSIPDVKWDDVGGLSPVREEFDFHIVQHIRSPELYKKFGKTSEAGFLLHGPPGCGKTLIAKAVANEAEANFIHIKGPELLNKYVGESELAIRTLFNRARTCTPCILFFDEIDALTTKREKEGGWVVERLVNQFLIELDGADDRTGVYVIGATNRIEAVDPAMLRPGRLGKVLYVPLPSPEDRALILKAIARKKPLSADVDLDYFGRSEACSSFSGADLYQLMEEAASIAIKEKQMAFKQGNMNMDSLLILPYHMEQALKKVSPSVSKKERFRYEKLSLSLGGL